MAGMTDTAFRRLVKRKGGCGLVVSEMVSSEGLVRGIDRTLEYAEYTEEERPVSIQIFGGDPEKMAAAAQIVEGMGADIVDVNMGCPVPKIAKHNAGCSLMREPAHAADVVRAMARAVKIPVTVKMRAGWDADDDQCARSRAADGRCGRRSRRGSRSYRRAVVFRRVRLGSDAKVAGGVSIPVFGSGDCIDPEQLVDRLRDGDVAGVLVGRGALRNPWIFEQAAALASGRSPRSVTPAERGQFLLDYIDLLLNERVDEAEGFRHVAPGQDAARPAACARPRSVGDQQAARAEFLVYQRARQRIASAHRDQCGGIDRPASGHDPALLFDWRTRESSNP